MKIIAQNQTENNINNLKGFWLHFYLKGNGSEFLDYDLPYPTYLEHYSGNGESYAVAWCIEGYFGTQKGVEFLNDVIARFLLSFADLSPRRLPYRPEVKKNNKTAHILNKAYSLKKFSSSLKSMPTKKTKIPIRAEQFEDLIFWAIKLYAEDLIRDFGVIPYQQLEDFALNQFLHKKDFSSIRCKTRNVFNWYEAKDFEIQEKKYKNNKEKYEGTKMTRIENMRKINLERAEAKRKKILNALTGLYSDTYKKKNGKWNISKISKELEISEKTVKKYLPKSS